MTVFVFFSQSGKKSSAGLFLREDYTINLIYSQFKFAMRNNYLEKKMSSRQNFLRALFFYLRSEKKRETYLPWLKILWKNKYLVIIRKRKIKSTFFTTYILLRFSCTSHTKCFLAHLYFKKWTHPLLAYHCSTAYHTKKYSPSN